MSFTLENIAIIALVLVAGLSAGLCFTWSNAVSPGISRLNDIGYLQAFQQINRVIINPIFIIIFFSPFLLNALNIYLFKSTSSSIMWLLILAMVFYVIGVILVTIFGNVPLNELVDKVDLNIANTEELKSLRDKFEVQWNRFHMVRTVASFISFLLLILTLIETIKINK